MTLKCLIKNADQFGRAGKLNFLSCWASAATLAGSLFCTKTYFKYLTHTWPILHLNSKNGHKNRNRCTFSKNFSLTLFFTFQHGNTALHEAAWKGFSQTVQILCKWKANAYIKNRGGFAPLHLCCQNGHNETCRVLLLAGCKPDIKNNVSN